jgi:hypothetical protein
VNSTLESINVAMNARLRDRRSSLAMTSLAFCFLQAASAFSKFWPVILLTALDLGELPDEVPPTAVEIVKDRLPLRPEAQS